MSFKTDLQEAIATAKAEGKRVLMDFTATWCRPCGQMEHLVFPAQAVADAGKDIIFVKIYEHEHNDLVTKYEVEAYPTLILLDCDGQVIRREAGYHSVSGLVDFLS